MSHEVENMAYVGETPWHSLGNEMKKGQSLEEWREKSGFNYQILSTPSLYRTKDGEIREREGESILYRSDTGMDLSSVTGKYKIVQPKTVLEFFRDLTQENGLEMETAGVLKSGRIYWAMAKTGESFEARKGDNIESRVLLFSSADKSLATTGKLISTRVVCWNTLSVARGEGGKEKRVKHSRHFDADAQAEVKTDLGLIDYASRWAKFKEDTLSLTTKLVSTAQAEAFYRIMLRPDIEDPLSILQSDTKAKALNSSGDTERTPRGLDMLMHAYRKAPGNVEGTAYGVLQGATYYVDHMRGTQADQRMYSAQFTQGAAFKDRAFALALAI